MPGGERGFRQYEPGVTEKLPSLLQAENNRAEIEDPEFGPDTNNRAKTEEFYRPEQEEDQVEAAVEVAEKQKTQEPLLFEKLPPEQQEKLLGQLLDGMRDVLGPVRDYAVFASTAMYLNGEKIVARGNEGGRELMKPPGDFDAALYKFEDMEQVRDRMRRMPDVIFANAKKDRQGNIIRDEDGEVVYNGRPGEYTGIPGQDLKILAGKRIFDVEIDGKQEKVAYDFEFFLNSRMVPKDSIRNKTTEAHGLRILNLDGLQEQYSLNLAYELKVNSATNEIIDYLHSDNPEVVKFKQEIMSIEDDDNVAITDRSLEILKHFDVGPEEMKKALELQDELDAIADSTDIPFAKLSQEGVMDKYVHAQRELGNEEKAQELEMKYKRTQELISKRNALISGSKTKIWKRDLNLIQLARLQSGG